MTDTYEHKLQWLLEQIQGKHYPYSQGLVSHDSPHPEQQAIHQACLELERQGHIVRQSETRRHIGWMPVVAHVHSPEELATIREDMRDLAQDILAGGDETAEALGAALARTVLASLRIDHDEDGNPLPPVDLSMVLTPLRFSD